MDHQNHSITSWCFNINTCLERKLRQSDEKITQLTLAHSLGWIGYTIFDDLRDNDKKIYQLSNKVPKVQIEQTELNTLSNWFITKSRTAFEHTLITKSADMYRGAFKIMNYSSIDPPSTVIGLWRRSAGILCAPYVILQKQISDGEPTSLNMITLVKLYLCKKHLEDDYIDRYSDFTHGLVTPFTILISDVTYFCTNNARNGKSRRGEKFIKKYLHVHILMINHSVDMLLDKMRGDTNRPKQSIWTKSGIEMFAKLFA